MRFNNLNDWLTWQESLNPKEIELGLDRVFAVLKKAGHTSKFPCPLIIVAGTNGKGSVVAMLEAMAMSAGLKVASYTSPHLFNYNERIKINTLPVSDNELCESFERLDKARGYLPLTYFEFGTLAAIDIFFKQPLDLVILEVGLGGRLDAVNVMDADVAILTSVAIDHIDWLGDNRETIGSEKAGVFRAGKPVICGDRNVPNSVVSYAQQLQCEFIQLGCDYEVSIDESKEQWHLQSPISPLSKIVKPSLIGEFQYDNAATGVLAMQTLQAKGLINEAQDAEVFGKTMVLGLQHIRLLGRFQKINEKPQVFVDVAHNIQAAQALAAQLKSTLSSTLKSANNDSAKTWAIFAMLTDKDVVGVIEQLSTEIDYWCFAGLDNIPRGLAVNDLLKLLPDITLLDDVIQVTERENLCKMYPTVAMQADSVAVACDKVLRIVNPDDRVIIFGSFYTVAQAMQFFDKVNNHGTESVN